MLPLGKDEALQTAGSTTRESDPSEEMSSLINCVMAHLSRTFSQVLTAVATAPICAASTAREG